MFSVSGFDNWIVGAGDNAANLVGNINLYANNNQEKFFWNNAGSFRLGFYKAVSGLNFSIDPNFEAPGIFDKGGWSRNVDEIYLSSLFGYKLSPVLALSVMADARTSFGQFFDPAYVSIGAGITYKPNADFTAVLHPISFRGTFIQTQSLKVTSGWEDLDTNIKGDLGAKLVIDYRRDLWKGIVWISNLNAFLAYSDFENPEITWLNDFGYQLNEFMSINLHYGLRFYKPETTRFQGESWARGNTYDVDGVATPLMGLDIDGDGLSNASDVLEAGDLTKYPYAFTSTGAETYFANEFANESSTLNTFINDNVKHFQQKWIFGIGFNTTFDLTRLPSLPMVGKN